ncbi:CsbD family protein [Carnimonas bestiolae]|uniref:CsbD family protein n=1 Tax=Carnimonas bestiolae TaxID=3402172 RepID=UPI003EDC9B41
MPKDRIEGKARELAGQAQEAFGEFTDDHEHDLRGKARQAAGAAQYHYGEAVDQVRDTTRENPFAALAVAAAVGFVFGRFLR